MEEVSLEAHNDNHQIDRHKSQPRETTSQPTQTPLTLTPSPAPSV